MFQLVLYERLAAERHTREEMEVLFTLPAKRYERGSVMLTNNLPFSKWEMIFEDPTNPEGKQPELIVDEEA